MSFTYLFQTRQEALEAAISERDAQLGLLEVAGIKTAKVADRAEDLKAERKRLMDLMKKQVTKFKFYFFFMFLIYFENDCLQNENRVKLLLEYEDSSHSFLFDKLLCDSDNE